MARALTYDKNSSEDSRSFSYTEKSSGPFVRSPTKQIDTIKMMITHGNLQLQELERTLKLAKS
ncbi:LYR motif-containing protein 2, partial [Ophiophagus hannah]